MAEQQSWQERDRAWIEDNMERGLWADFRTSRLYSAVVRKGKSDRYEMSFRSPGIQEHGTEDFQTIDDLIEAMREVEPDLRRWHLCEAEV